MVSTAEQQSPQPGGAAPEHLDVLIIGAGISGIDAAYRLQTECPGKSFALLEAREAIGGTWDFFRYPGIRSDSDMTTLGFPFRPWRGAKAIADGEDIRRYVVETAETYGIDRKVRLGWRVVRLDWSSDTARWTVDAEVGPKRRPVQLSCAFLFLCSGYYDYAAGYQPTFPDQDAFTGTVVHPQAWPEALDYTGKRVVVIGSGATAVTLVPALAERAAHVTMLQRTPSYVVAREAEDRLAHWAARRLPAPLADRLVRWKNIGLGIATYRFCRSFPVKAKALIVKGAGRALGPAHDLAHFTPDYAPWDQRVCLVPDGDLFRALRDKRASVVTDRIEAFTAEGLRLASGTTLEADIVVTATGLVLQMAGGAQVAVDGVPVDPAERLVYKGMMLDGVPNLAIAFGYTNASWTLKCDLTARQVCRLLQHMERHGYRQCMPQADPSLAREPLLDFTSGYVQRAAGVLPKQGPRTPWRVHQNYLLDYAAFRLGRPDDGVMRFTGGAQPPASTARSRETRMRLAGRVALITGAASGIGRSLALALADRGCHLALADVNAAGLAETAAAAERRGVRVSQHALDVADGEAVAELPGAIEAVHGGLDLLINNAGVALGGTFEQSSEADFEWLFNINFWGVVRMTRAFLPLLKRSDEARLVNLSSLFGLIAPPGQVAYAASKFAVRGFSEALRKELEGTSVGVTTVHPGGVATAIANNARACRDMPVDQQARSQRQFQRLLRLAPERAAQIIVEAIERRRPRVLVGNDARLAATIERLLPVTYWSVLKRGM